LTNRINNYVHAALPQVDAQKQHWPDRTKTLYTLLVFGENSIYFDGAERLPTLWLDFKTHKRKESLRLMRYKF
jgi:hypothetical protein